MELATTTVLLGFDGTLVPSSGHSGGRQSLEERFRRLPRDQGSLLATARQARVDTGFGPLIKTLKASGAEVMVVSDSFGFDVEEALAPYDVQILTNRVDWDCWELTYPNRDRCCACTTCGTCKQAPIKDARRRGRRTVFVGHDVTDRKAALLADVLFAAGPLAEWCDDFDVTYTPFDTLEDVRRALRLNE